MHFEVLVEDASGGIFLKKVIPKILGADTKHSFRIHDFKGIGRIPRNMKASSDPSKRILLDQLPRLLRGYGKSLLPREQYAVIVVLDCDDKNCKVLLQELANLLSGIEPAPQTVFRIAIEEMEAWMLGDRNAIQTAYPSVKMGAMSHYEQDSICGTWELLADALYPGGAKSLKQKGFPHTGIAKCEWAERIAPHLNFALNTSPSFHKLLDAFYRFTTSEP